MLLSLNSSAFYRLIVFVAIFVFSSAVSANEMQFSISGDLWGLPVITTPKPGDEPEVLLGIGKSLSVCYLNGEGKGTIFGIGYRDMRFGYSRLGSSSFSGTDTYWYGELGYWVNVRTVEGVSSRQVHYSLEYGSGNIHLSDKGLPSKNAPSQYLSLNVKSVNPINMSIYDARPFWYASAGLFHRFFEFTYDGGDFSSSSISGPGRFLNFNIGIGIRI
ncbi:hypothetical protein [Bdellovibrio bacteriovorus]|uniref:hypothetical protein n=1 Tax=Bdellovibrio bacteriovorus TaxID=959 RepID=UPI0035A88D16